MDTANTTIAENNAGLAPVGAIFNVYSKKFEEFVIDYLREKQISGVTDVKVMVRGAGTNHASPTVYAFLNRNTNVVGGDRARVAGYLANKIEGSNTVKLSQEGKEKFAPVVNLNKLNTGSAPDSEIYVELDIFRCLGLYLSARYKQHRLTIFEINRVNDEIVLTVIKQDVPKASFFTGNGDKRAQWLEKQQGRRY